MEKSNEVQKTESDNKNEKTEEKNDGGTNVLNQTKLPKPKKNEYLNQKVVLPYNLPDRIEYIRDLFYNEELGYTVNYAPMYESSNLYEIGKYFKIKQKNIFEIASAILFYIYKTFKIKIISKFNEDKKNNNKNEVENNKRTSEEILKSGEILSVDELCEFYKDLCYYAFPIY